MTELEKYPPNKEVPKNKPIFKLYTTPFPRRTNSVVLQNLTLLRVVFTQRYRR